MEVNCEGCAGCCMDWRASLEDDPDRRQRPAPFASGGDAARAPLDDDTNFVPLTREEVRAFLDAGMAPALTPRFWQARDGDEGVTADGYRLAAVAGRPVFFVGLRKPPKPVAPFGREEPAWLPACVFLDPETLQCRIHGDDLFPDECGAYPAHNVALDQETECERVESAFGGERLLEADADGVDGLLLGSQALGAKLFAHPRPDTLEGTVARAAEGELTAVDRAECLAVAAASSPGTLAISEHHYERARAQALETTGDDREEDDDPTDGDRDASWVGPAIREWYRRRRETDGTVPSPDVAADVEDARGAPATPGWDALE